jgi:hypothetical protein
MQPSIITLEERIRKLETFLKEVNKKDELASWELDFLRTRRQCRDIIKLFADEEDDGNI